MKKIKMEFESWLNDFCIYHFYLSYDALVSQTDIKGETVKTLVAAIRDYFEKDIDKVFPS